MQYSNQIKTFVYLPSY